MQDKIIEKYYEALLNEETPIHIPRSDVFYVRNSLEVALGTRYSLDHVERAMYLEGFLKREDVLDPDRPREGVG